MCKYKRDIQSCKSCCGIKLMLHTINFFFKIKRKTNVSENQFSSQKIKKMKAYIVLRD